MELNLKSQKQTSEKWAPNTGMTAAPRVKLTAAHKIAFQTSGSGALTVALDDRLVHASAIEVKAERGCFTMVVLTIPNVAVTGFIEPQESGG